jgi:hypothetical protein
MRNGWGKEDALGMIDVDYKPLQTVLVQQRLVNQRFIPNQMEPRCTVASSALVGLGRWTLGKHQRSLKIALQRANL